MRRRTRSAVVLMAVILGAVRMPIAHLSRLLRRPPAAALKQIAYLKASNPSEDAHFGCGGTLTGHAGNASAISDDGNTIAIGAPHESSGAKGINGNQNDKSVYSAGAVYVFTRRGHDRGAAGLHQGVEPRNQRQFRLQRRLEPRRQHDGGRRLLRVQRRDRDQRQPERSLDPGGRGRLCLYPHRHHLVAAGVYQGLEHGQRRRRRRFRRRRSVRLLHRVELRRQHAGGRRDRRRQQRHGHQRRPGGQLDAVSPARRTCSRGAAAPGRSRPTSSRR